MIEGYRVRRTRRGFLVVECEYYAIPRTPEWVRQKQETLGTRKWRREYERDRTVGGEAAFFSEFNVNVHVKKIAGLLPRVVARGFDFGRRHPACVWLQVSPSNRAWFLREVVLDDVGIYDFRDLVKYLSGQLPIEELKNRPKALKYLDWLDKERDYFGEPMPKPPWFENVPFVDFAGHEAVIDRSGILETESEEKTYADVFRVGGIQLSHHYQRVAARVTLMRQLLGTRGDGQPGAYFDPACPTLIKAMAGALSFKKGTKLNPKPEEPSNVPRYLDVFDASSYPLPSLIGVEEDPTAPEPRLTHTVVRGEDWRTAPDPPSDALSIDSGLTRMWEDR